jgi:peptide/nickel transport system ATP-binding protein
VTSSILAANNAPLLDVRDLCVDFVNGSAVTHAVRGVSFQLGREKLAIVGESGSVSPPLGARCCSCIRKSPRHRQPDAVCRPRPAAS